MPRPSSLAPSDIPADSGQPAAQAPSLDDIVRERTAGLPFDQGNDIARRTILDALKNQPTVLLTGLVKLYLALELERLWILKKELRKIERQRVLKIIEDLLETIRWSRKHSRPKQRRRRGQRPPTATEILEFVGALTLRDGSDSASGFPTAAALKQFLKRARRERREQQAKKKARR